MDFREYNNKNKVAWEEVNSLHQKFKERYKNSLIKDENFVVLDRVLLNKLTGIGLKGKSVLHPCCNDGEELISLKKLGAGRCVGVDISETAIKSAQELNDKLGFDCEFFASDVYDIDEVISETFDVVLITVGALLWLPDLDMFFRKISGLMNKGAKLIIQEQHPFSWVIDEEMKLSKVDLYFKKGPYAEKGGLDYLGNVEYEGKINYTFNYTLTELLNFQIKNGLAIESFDEYPYDISNLKEDLEKEEASYPLSYICISGK